MTQIVPGFYASQERLPLARRLTTALRLIPALLFGCLLLYSPEAEAQEFIDTRGREFFVTFLPNWHNDPGERQDSLYLFFASERATQVRLNYRDVDGNVFNEVFQLQPNVMETFQVEAERFELIGNTRGNFANSQHRDRSLPSQDQRTAQQHFHIESDEEITVYGLNEAIFSSDAFAAFPVDAIGTEYMIMSYKTDRTALAQFAVVAEHNDTRVEIVLSDESTQSNSGETINITLNRGESYLVQGAPSPEDDPNPTDLTGTRINSDKEVAVFAGHMRSRISYESPGISRDHLVQQLHAIPNWGGGAFVTPYVNSDLGTNPVRDLYRVLAARDDTDVYIDGEYLRTLQAGDFYEAEVTDALWVTASGPVMVAQFKKTSNVENFNLAYGDPFMIINSPIEQYMDRYFFSSIDATTTDDDGNLEDKFSANQYVTIIAPTNSLETVTLDGQPIPADAWKKLSITTYSYTDNLQVASGTHTVTGSTPIGVYVYGYGEADSYGYIGGMRFQRISEFAPPDIIPPAISFDPCQDGFFTGQTHDTLSFDRGIQEVRLDESSNNVNLSDVIVSQPADSATFVLRLQDPYQDGEARVISADSTGREQTQTVLLPGFTVYVDKPRDELEEVEAVGRADGTELCRTITLVNYGRFEQEVTNIAWASGETDISITPTNFALPAGESIQIRVCASSIEELTLTESLVIEGGCAASAVVAEVELDFKRDRNRPRILSTEDPCDGFTRSVITDILSDDWGIAEIDILNATNIGTLEVDRTNLPDSVIVSVSILDRTRSARYTIIVTDEAGNVLDTTIVITPVDVEFLLEGDVIEFGEISIGGLECVALQIRNNSSEPYVIDEVTLRDNIRFSVPRSQIPFTLAPNSTVGLDICFDAPLGEAYDDEIFFRGDCFEALLKLNGTGAGASFTANSNCGVTVNGRHTDVPGTFFVENVFPNPTERETRLIFGLPEQREVRVELVNSMGVSFGEVMNESFNAGIYDLNLAIERLEQGVYFLIIDLGKDRVTQQLNLIR